MIGGTTIRTIEWTGNALVLLDQRRLPASEEYVVCRTSDDVAAAIVDMVVRGAPAIGVSAAYGVALAAQAGEDLAVARATLRATRPTAVNLGWALERMERHAATLDPDALVEGLAREAAVIHTEDEACCASLAEHGLALFDDRTTVLTHCNTGALATAGIGTALGMVRAAWRAGRGASVYADETRPWLQGARLTAWECLKDEIPCTVLADAAAASLLASGRIDLVVVGTDRTAANGDVANKIGTYPLAVLARRHGVPFYVAAPTSSIDLSIPSGAAIEIEQRGEEEVTYAGGTRIAPEGVQAYNPAFDVTPAELVTAIITERGIARAPYGKTLPPLVRGGASETR